jgi:hypothetical protein
MNNHQKGSVNGILVIVIVILVAVVAYFGFIKKPQPVVVQPVNTPLPQTLPTATAGQQVETTIYVPANQAEYDQMVDNDDNGVTPETPGTASLTDADFKPENVMVTITPSYGIEQATADAVAATIKTQTVIKTAGFKVVDGTAYVVTNIDIDGWAGSGSSEEAVDPLINRTLLQFPDIKSVQINGLEAYKMCGIQPD